MARFASQEKAGYYPLPPTVTTLISQHLEAEHGGRICDPCAGTGTALVELADTLNLEAYGNEIDLNRSKALYAQIQKLRATQTNLPHTDANETRTKHGSIDHVRTSPESYNLLYLNPPYDWDGEGAREEFNFLKTANKWLQPKGVLVFVIPMIVLTNLQTTKYITAWYENVKIRKFPTDQYLDFKQVVLFATKRKQKVAPNSKLAQKIKLTAQNEMEVASGKAQTIGTTVLTEINTFNTLTSSEFVFPLPPIKRIEGFKFDSVFINSVDAEKEATAVGAATTKAFKTLMYPTAEQLLDFRPLMPLKIGHLASLIAAGFLNNQILDNGEERILIKGRSFKGHRSKTKVEPINEKGDTKSTTVVQEYALTEISTITASGDISIIAQEDLPDFLEKWLPQLTSAIAEQYAPVYKFDATTVYDERIGKRGSLFPVQKHAVKAIATRLEKHDDALLIGEMGTGKTRTAATIVAATKTARTLILCPSHLAGKWKREAEMVLPEAGSVMLLKTLADVQRYFKRDATPETPVVGVMKFNAARAGSGWESAVDYWQLFSLAEMSAYRKCMKNGTPLPPELEEKRHLIGKWQRLMNKRGVRCPVTGQQITDKDGLPVPYSVIAKSKKQLSINSGKNSKPAYTRHYYNGASANGTKAKTNARYNPLFQEGTPNRKAKTPLANYILKKHKNKIGLLLVDEVHKLKGHDTDQGYALGRLASACKKVVGLTGTIYGGKSSTLFPILYRIAKDVRKEFTHKDATGKRRIDQHGWIDTYGMMKHTHTTRESVNGKQSGNERSSITHTEAPGSSPTMLPWLLSRSVFMSLSDMGFALPDYEEIPVGLDMESDQIAAISQLKNGVVGQLMRQRLVRGDRSLLGAYLQANISMPDAAWRDEIIEDPRTKREEYDGPPKVLDTIYGTPREDGHLWPKEAAILKQVKEETQAGRGVLLLVQQTGTRDITGEWETLLKNINGVRPVTMRVSADKREDWIKKQSAMGTNVILAHAKSVETGLDIMDYPTIIWMGTEYSVYTILQASRRSWRIGQKKPVKVYFYYYHESMQETALHLIAQKAAAAARVSGDVIAIDSIANIDEGSVESQLTDMILKNESTSTQMIDVASMFANANEAQRQAGTYIGAEMPDEPEPEPEPEPEVKATATWKKAAIIPTRSGYKIGRIHDDESTPVATRQNGAYESADEPEPPKMRYVFGVGMVPAIDAENVVKGKKQNPYRAGLNVSKRTKKRVLTASLQPSLFG